MKKILLFLLVCGIAFSDAFAVIETPSTQGSEFYISFMRTNSSKTITTSLTISSPASGTIELHYFDGSPTKTVSIVQGVQTIVLDNGVSAGVSTKHYTQKHRAIEKSGCQLLAFDATAQPLKVSVFANMQMSLSCDAANVYPIDALGNEYYAISRSANEDGSRSDAESEFLIVAAEDGTTIDIYPSCVIEGQSASDDIYANNDKITVTLNKGETYLVAAQSQLLADEGRTDLTGTRIVGRDCKKFAVFSGVGYGCGLNSPHNNGDYEYDQLFPVHLWGTDYITGALTYDYNGSIETGRDEIRVVASQPCTEVYINGQYVTTLNQGDYYSHKDPLGLGTYVHASKPVEVGLFATGQNAGTSNWGAPALMVLAPLQQYLSEVLFTPFNAGTDVTGHSVMITSLTSIKDSTYLNGIRVANWTPITSNPDYSQAMLPVNVGTSYDLRNTVAVRYDAWKSDPAKKGLIAPDSIGGFNAVVYASTCKNSGYGYSVGASATVIKTSFDLNGINSGLLGSTVCVDKAIDLEPKFPEGLVVSKVEWDYESDGVIDETSYAATNFKVSHAYPTSGVYKVKMIAHKSFAASGDCWSNSGAGTTDEVSAEFRIKQYVYETTKSPSLCKGDSLIWPLATALASEPIANIRTMWTTAKVLTGKDSLLFAYDDMLNIDIPLNYGVSRKYWRRSWVTTNKCDIYVDTFNVSIKPIAGGQYTNQAHYCKGEVLTSTRTASSETDLNGRTVTYAWFDGNVNTPVNGATNINYTVNDDFGASKKYIVESKAGCLFRDTFNVVIPNKVTNSLSTSHAKVCGDGSTQVTITATQAGDVTSTVWEESNDGVSFAPLAVAGLQYGYAAFDDKVFRITSSGNCENASKAPAAPAIVSTVSVQANTPFVASLEVISGEFIAPYMLPISGGKVKAEVTTDVAGAYNYTWTPSEIKSGATYDDQLTKPKTYKVEVVDADGLCRSTTNEITVKLGEVKLHTILIPSSLEKKNKSFAEFSENGDPLTMTFTYGYKLTIFNRYGQSIFTNTDGGWNGTNNGQPADAGVYFYVLEYNTVNGSEMLKGSIEVLK